MKEKYYYPVLDGLRFLAFFAVFIHHGPALTWIPGYKYFRDYGWIGVDLFLCLSAFLFVHLLRMEWEKTGTINVWFFYLRRSLRIWPIYIIFVTAIVAFMIARYDYTTMHLLRTIGLLTFTDNLLAARFGYNPLLWLAHLWTISYEEQFYAVIPWFLLFMFRKTQLRKLAVLGIIFVTGLGVRAIFIAQQIPHPAIWVLPVTHFESILFGLAIGLGIFDRVFKHIPAWMTALAGIFCLYLCVNLPNANVIDWSLMLLYPLVGLSVAFLVHSSIKAQSSFATAWLSWQPIVYLGKISYGLYLFHVLAIYQSQAWVTLNFGGKSLQNQSYLAFGLGLAITIMLAALSYSMIEKPFLKMKSRFTIVQSRPV